MDIQTGATATMMQTKTYAHIVAVVAHKAQ